MIIAKEYQGRRATAVLPVLNQAGTVASGGRLTLLAGDDDQLLDAYSRTVSGVAENAGTIEIRLKITANARNMQQPF